MAYKIKESSHNSISLEEFVHFVQTEVNFADEASIVAASRQLFQLHNNRTFLCDRLNQELKEDRFQVKNQYSGESIILHSNPNYLVRAVTWVPEASNPIRRTLERDVNYYGVAHDHSFNLLTIGYFGPGYVTDFYEYDRSKVAGYVGEVVEMTFLERTQLGQGEVLFMRESKDIHIQYPPESLSISLNLMSTNPARAHDIEQFLFDVEKKTIIGYPHFGSSNRVGLIAMTELVADGNTLDILYQIAKKHHDPRTRFAAYRSLHRHLGHSVLEGMARDCHPLVSSGTERSEFYE